MTRRPALDGWVSMREAASSKGVSPEAIRLAVLRGLIRAQVVHSRLTLVSVADVEAYTPKAQQREAGRLAAERRAG